MLKKFYVLLFFLCHNGHTLCSACKSRVHNRCPT
uniref:E3 ubiquitin-protein ligase Sina-like RING finger domain-containing protein n=1 Tax=Musa acuminata subsp. malaccensis TaxID=214687 RepID=A0A804JVS0_MUSAM